jgi:glycosyltransferase involved in cell wall biosynthesis
VRSAKGTSVSKKSVILAGQFTPPIHGMAVATDALGAVLATLGPLIRLRTVPTRSARGGRLYHLRRACLVTRAAYKMSYLRPKSDAVVLSVDAGKGMSYVILLTWIARLLRYRVVLQHHSYAYLSRRSRLAATLVYVGGSRAHHLHSCPLACDDFRGLYPRAVRTSALSVAYALASPPSDRTSTDAFAPRQITVGHMSNLTLEKGLDEVIRFGRTALKESKVAKVILAGPFSGDAERELLDAVASEPGFEYRGPVFGQRKEDFFRDIDLFLFPTHYRHESFGLVVWEAMLRGVPVIAYRAGCLTQAAAGEGNLVMEPSDDFTTLGIRRIDRWSRSPAEFSYAMTAAAAVARREREQAVLDALQLGAELFAAPGNGAGTPMAW